MAELPTTHIRTLKNEAMYCGPFVKGESISHDHYLEQFEKPNVAGHLKVLKLCQFCVDAIEFHWSHTIKGLKERQCQRP